MLPLKCWRGMNLCGVDRSLLNSRRDHMAHRRVGTVRVQVGGPMSFIGVTYKNMGEGLFIGAEVAQRHGSSPRPTPAPVTACKSWEPRAHCSACERLRQVGELPFQVTLV